MNVELPDGTVVEDVPDNITRADLATKLKANGMTVPDEWTAKRKVGVVETALRTAGEAARTAVGMFDMAAVGMARMLGGEKDVQETLDIRQARQQDMREAYGQKPDEEFSPTGQVLGGVAGMPIEVAGGLGAQHGFERATEVLDRGGSMRQAAGAGTVTGGVRAALNALPVKAGGVVGKAIESRLGAALGGAVTGGAIAGVGGMAGRAAENAVVPEGEQFQDLKQDTGPDLVEIGMGAAFGALPGAAAAGRRTKERKAAKAEAEANVFPVDKMTDLGDGEYRAPNGATITQEAWDAASPRVRQGWLKAAEKVPAGEAKELGIKPEDIERQAEIDRIKQEHPAGPVAEAVQAVEAKRAKAAEKEASETKARADAAELRRAAGLTKDPEVQAELRARADKLDPPGKIPVGKVTEGQPGLPDETPKKPLPVGEATELPVERIDAYEPIPVGEAREITPERGADAPEGQIPVGEAAEVLPVGEATEIPHIPVGEATEMIPVGEATEIPAKKIPVGKATEITPERIELGGPDGQQLRPDDLQPEARTEGSQTPGREEGTTQGAARTPADEEIAQLRAKWKGLADKSDEVVRATEAWDRAKQRLAAVHRGGYERANEIGDEIAAAWGQKRIKNDQVGYLKELTRRLDAETIKATEDENTPGTLANRRRAKEDSKAARQRAAAEHKANLEEISLAARRAEELHRQGRLTQSDLEEIVRIGEVSSDSFETAYRMHKLIDSKEAPGREGAIGKDSPAANESLDLNLPRIDENFMRAQERVQQAKTPPPDERGVAAVRRALQEGRDSGKLDKDGADLALWALDRNRHLAHKLKVDARVPIEGGIANGSYNSASRVITLFKGRDNPRTAIHEILHHTERMMPPEVQQGIRRAWEHAVEAAKRENPKVAKALDDARKATAGDKVAFKRMLDAFRDGTLSKDQHYHLVDPSEFWAVNGARVMHERFTGRGSWRAKARQWLREMVAHIKHTVGLRSDAPILKALDDVLDPKKTTGADLSEGTIKQNRGEALDINAPTRAKLPEETAAEEQARRWIDSLKPVERAQGVVAPKGEADDMRLAMKLAPGRIGGRAQRLERDFIEPLGKAMKQAKKAGLTVKDVDDYLTALHAPERNAVIAQRNAKMPDGGSGLTNDQAREIIDSFTHEQRKHLDGIAKQVHEMNRAKLDQMVEDGLIAPEVRDRLNKQYKAYVPLKTLDKEDEFTGVGRGYEMRPNDITSALGRTSRASSPVAASIMDATRAIARGERARVDKSIWEYAQNEEAAGLLREYDPDRPPPEMLRNALGKDGQVKQEVDPRKLQEHVVSLVVDGQQKRIYVPNAELAEALRTAGDPQRVGKWLQMYGTLTRAFSRTMTEWNPAFAPVNVVKDTTAASIRAKRLGLDATAVVTGVPRAMRDIVQFKRGKGGDLYREMKAVGGAQGAYGLTRFGDTLGRLEKLGAELGYDEHKGGAGRKFSKALGTLGEAVSHFNEVFEYSVRLSAYRNAKAKGMSPAKAAAAARDITLDFNVNGEVGRRLGHAYSFFNAAVQGIANDVKDLKDSRTRLRMLSLLGVGAAVQAVNEVFGGVSEDTGEKKVDMQYEGVQDDNAVLVPFGAKIPLPVGLPAALYAVGRRLTKMAFGGDIEKEAAGIVSAVAKASVPVRIGDSNAGAVSNVLSAVVPSIPAPFYMLETNRDGLGRPIIPEQHGKATAPYHTTSQRTTSGVAKAISKGLNTLTGGDDVTPGAAQRYLGKYTSPEAIEFLVGYYTGGVGQLAMQSKNIVETAAEGKPLAVDKIPVLKRFVVSEPQGAVDRRYKEISEDFERAKKYQKLGQDEKIAPAVLNALPEYIGAEKELTALFKGWREATDTTERERIGAEIKQVQSRVIKAFNQGENN